MEAIFLDNMGVTFLVIIIAAVLLVNIYSDRSSKCRQSSIHFPINGGEHWPSPKIEAALEKARFKKVQFDEVKKMYVTNTDGNQNKLRGQIEVRIIECQGRKQVRFTSKVSAKTAILDYAKNRRNVKKFSSVYSDLKISG